MKLRGKKTIKKSLKVTPESNFQNKVQFFNADASIKMRAMIYPQCPPSSTISANSRPPEMMCHIIYHSLIAYTATDGPN